MQPVDYAAVFGAGRTLPTALLVISKDGWQDDHRQLCQRLRAEATRVLAPLPPYLRPAGLAVTSRAFTIAAGELTANFKLRRRNIEANFAGVLNELESHIDNAPAGPDEIQSKDGFTLFIRL